VILPSRAALVQPFAGAWQESKMHPGDFQKFIADLADRPTHMLSFGQKKRAAIAGAVAMRPEILLLDEPTAGLDQQSAPLLLAVLEQLEAKGTTLVFTTHDVDLAWAFVDDEALFKDGRVIAQGVASEILIDEERMSEAGLNRPARIGLAARASGALAAGAPQPLDEASALALLS
jgi:cobalt/nickel transport system ATP-binding protein